MKLNSEFYRRIYDNYKKPAVNNIYILLKKIVNITYSQTKGGYKYIIQPSV